MALMRWKTSYGGGAVLLGLVLSFLTSVGCVTEPDSVKKDTTNLLINIVKLSADSNDPNGTTSESDFLLSDVCFSNDTNPPCSTFNDNGIVEMQAQLKDRTQTGTSMDSVVFERYRVTFVRADGRNVAGVDVPYPFDGAMNFTVPFDGNASAAFVVVRHQAKAEPPLLQIAQDRAGILSVIAQIDFYGHDLAGRSYTITGYLNITFADFANQ
jgi:hypothetical protein